MYHHLRKVPSFSVETPKQITAVASLYDLGFVSISEVYTHIPDPVDLRPVLRWFPGGVQPSKASVLKAINRRARLVKPREIYIVTATPKYDFHMRRGTHNHEASLWSIDEQYLIGRVFESLSEEEQDMWRNIRCPVHSEGAIAIVNRTVLSFNCNRASDFIRLHEFCKRRGFPYRVY